jgi:type IV secretion system protein VirB9
MKRFTILALIGSAAFAAAQVAEPPLPENFIDQADKLLEIEDQAPAASQSSPEVSRDMVSEALDALPPGRYIGELPEDLYLQLAEGKEGETALKLVQRWEREGREPLLRYNGRLVYTFGSGTPLAIVKPAELTDIELEEGEEVHDILIGDTIRWSVVPTMNGSPDGLSQVTHVIVKAKQANLTSSLIISTNRRTYRLRLVSSSTFHLPLIAFNYPESEMRRKQEAYSRQIDDLEREKLAVSQKAVAIHESRIAELEAKLAEKEFKAKVLSDPRKLSFFYNIRREKGRPRWTPISCYNDGTKTYIVMPNAMNTDEAPILLLDNGKKSEMVNYRLVDNKFVVDRVFHKAKLVSGVGWGRDEVSIERTR